MQGITRKYTIAALLILLGFLIIIFFENPKIKDFLGQKIQMADGRTNVLIMGVAGKEHAGEDLTDTMILASVSFSRPKITLISIPRDLWIPEIRTKVNSAYHYGGLSLAKESVTKVTGVPIQFGVVIDFSGFKDVIDALGGVEVNVETGFTDKLYPIAGKENDTCGGDRTYKCRYETVSFSAGRQIMDGETALKFVRSRHAEGPEGTDTAREARQQKVIQAIKSKILSPEVYLNPIEDIRIYKVVRKLVQTDMDSVSTGVLLKKAFEARNSISQYLIPQELLKNPPISPLYDNLYVFIPRLGNGNWKEVKTWVTSVLP